MTQEEAIKILDDKVLLLPTCPDIVREAVYMAIEALRTRNVPDTNVGDMISRQAAIDAIEDLPSAQSDIIRCNACKHWTQTTGNMPGFGLGDCDYLNAKLVSCNGFCYWAERRTNA